jgi:glycosyltransferase involved in cell wall biosynthesis
VKVLLSAYACEPDKGSEPAVGWNWAVEIARRGHEVRVLTRANNRAAIEHALAAMADPPHLHFLYYDLPRWLGRWKGPGVRLYVYYLLWQWRAAGLARAAGPFDLVHHLTFASLRFPSFLGALAPRFAFGPAGGGEEAPARLLASLGWRSVVGEAFRILANRLSAHNPLMRACLARAERIYVATGQSRRLVPVRLRDRVAVAPAVGCAPADGGDGPKGSEFRILHVGRLVGWKGGALAVAATARLVALGAPVRLTIAGAGPEEARLRREAARLGIAEAVTWSGWLPPLPGPELASLYRDSHVLLYPSLHDSGGMAVAEALAHGLPVVCLDLGGPAEMVDESCGRVIPASSRRATDVVADLARALERLHGDAELRARLAEGARRRAEALSWRRRVAAVYEPLEQTAGTG